MTARDDIEESQPSTTKTYKIRRGPIVIKEEVEGDERSTVSYNLPNIFNIVSPNTIYQGEKGSQKWNVPRLAYDRNIAISYPPPDDYTVRQTVIHYLIIVTLCGFKMKDRNIEY